jgi:glycerol-3-phosphate dehydrogenase
MGIIAKVWNWIKSLFGFGTKPAAVVAPKAPAAPLSGAALAEELNKQTTPLSGAALAEQLNKQSPAAAPVTKTKKAVAKKTTKKKG